jgi:ribosomal protein S18 acetylase RimI-like enzyme
MNLDKNSITYKRASVKDIETLIDYRIIFLNETYGTQAPELISSLRKTLRQYFVKSFENDSFVSWIAEYEKKSVGFGGMVIREQPGNYNVPNGRTGYILNMFTVKEFRKNGICSSIILKLIEEAKQKKLDRIELYASKDGEPIYRQFGFQEPNEKALELILK